MKDRGVLVSAIVVSLVLHSILFLIPVHIKEPRRSVEGVISLSLKGVSGPVSYPRDMSYKKGSGGRKKGNVTERRHLKRPEITAKANPPEKEAPEKEAPAVQKKKKQVYDFPEVKDKGMRGEAEVRIPEDTEGKLLPDVADEESKGGDVGQTESPAEGIDKTGDLPLPEGLSGAGYAHETEGITGEGHYRAGGEGTGIDRYISTIKDIVKRNIYYPPLARRAGMEGKVMVEMLIMKDGKLEDLRVSGTSGSTVLDNAAVRIIKRSQPFPSPPRDWLRVRIPVVFILNE
ncbi:gram-negative bacterial tonB protein [bacterium BMS3Bbin06]|nr:gram-negative bacterial tonB protein [bacterium BMS3Abin08]GBE35525.1 gram-negative bacterial tonB protein [bacterium BMS3Bbin06]HDH01375.1 energy transducer TonB [Nitrospirota bacterium]HDY72116.1 energy transducer TonB [Nitrospirota bacterium]